ncbi:GNAT family N-acetyltransferase [Tahibacter soli]|jgi:GNAT superfamily N-acetyltransferase|uniref:GNAT family N-acetyltransferase n=1 Tax=Tahibacter soli TaxID=2983605 RepID=A0A9X3YGN4_9GAMM|nr:GNAT family N-acetyltransferase [Tahibacter soli]MDC8011841.1 GNAT family N-acetyltransferase [Tahibacter soli]
MSDNDTSERRDAAARYTIRAAREDEAQRLSTLMRACFLAAYRDSATPENIAAHLDRSYRTDLQAAELARPQRRTLVAEADGAWAGYAQVDFATDPPVPLDVSGAVQLSRIYLLPEHHGTGLAARLLGAVRDLAAGQGAGAWWLTVWKESPRAIAFYRAQGFREVGECTFLIGDDPQVDYVMVGPIRPAG